MVTGVWFIKKIVYRLVPNGVFLGKFVVAFPRKAGCDRIAQPNLVSNVVFIYVAGEGQGSGP